MISVSGRIGLMSSGILFFLSVAIGGYGATDNKIDDINYDDNELREGAVTIENSDDNDLFRASYPFIKKSANAICLNGADWTGLSRRYASCDSGNFSFVHIGDSHLQADISTGEMRKQFQRLKGNAGRGLVVPFRLSGSNEPVDYRFTLDCSYTSSRILKRPWSTEMDFTGVGIAPSRRNFELKIESIGDDVSKFRFVRLYVDKGLRITNVSSGEKDNIRCSVDYDDDDGYLDIFLSEALSDVTLECQSRGFATFHGALLSNEENGVFYHVIGNNGATYMSYNVLGNFGHRLSTLYPDLIIISLGTNDAFGKMDSSEFYYALDAMIRDIKKCNPECQILLTTPMECQRRIRTGKGNRRRSSYSVVENCKRFRDVLMDYGAKHGIAVYDWWLVAGGEGSSSKWLSQQLLSRDRVHLTHAGYRVAGLLLYEALQNVLSVDKNM